MMRLAERTLWNIRVAPLLPKTDALGGMQEAFSKETLSYRCVAVPGGNTLNYAANSLNALEHGLYPRRNLKLLFPRHAQIHIGDGVCLEDEDEPGWRCTTIETWSGHIVVKIEKRA